MIGRPKIVKNGKNMAVYMDQDMQKRIREEAIKQDLSPSQLIRKIIKDYFKTKEVN